MKKDKKQCLMEGKKACLDCMAFADTTEVVTLEGFVWCVRDSSRLFSTVERTFFFFFLHWQSTVLLRNGVEWRRVTAKMLEMEVKCWKFKRTADMKVSKKGWEESEVSGGKVGDPRDFQTAIVRIKIRNERIKIRKEHSKKNLV